MQFWDGYDLVLTPALAKRPVRHGEIDPCGENPAYEFKKSGEFTPYTAPFNVTGQPAISVPLYHGDDGLPLAVQLVGAAARRGHAAAGLPPARGGPSVGRPGARRSAPNRRL